MEEHVPNGGLKDKILSLAFKNKIKSDIKTFTLKDKFIHFYGTYSELLEVHGLSSKNIVSQILKKKGKKKY